MRASAKQNADGNPTVSVILPVYQVVDYLDECVSSILAQTFSDFELVIVDDGSTDGSGEKCDAWAERDDRIVVIHQANAGQSAARNLGIGEARGEYLLFIDSDDYISPALIDKSTALLRSTQSDICFYRYELLRANGKLEPYKESGLFPKVSSCDASEALTFLFNQCVHHFPWARIAKVGLYRADPVFFPVGRKMEDIATTARLMTRASRICFLDENLYVYREREGSTISEWSHQLTIDSDEALADIERDVRDQPEEVRIAALNYRVKFLFYCLMMESGLPNSDLGDKAVNLARGEMRAAAKRCGWGNLSRSNKLKIVLMKMRLEGLAAKMRKE